VLSVYCTGCMWISVNLCVCCNGRLVEEVREACEVDMTNDDVFMNSRCMCMRTCVCACVTKVFIYQKV